MLNIGSISSAAGEIPYRYSMHLAQIAKTSDLSATPRFSGWRIGLVVLLGCVLFLSGCATINISDKKRQAFSEHVAKADEMEQQDRLADALDQWRIATAIYPESIEANQRARTLEDRIIARVSELTAQADRAASTGHLETSGQLLLSALSMQPDNQVLIQRVVTFKRRAAYEKVEASPSPADPSLYGDSNLSEGASVASLQAEAKFQLGVEKFGSDKTRAGQLFLEALELDPTHLGARAYLQVLSEE